MKKGKKWITFTILQWLFYLIIPVGLVIYFFSTMGAITPETTSFALSTSAYIMLFIIFLVIKKHNSKGLFSRCKPSIK